MHSAFATAARVTLFTLLACNTGCAPILGIEDTEYVPGSCELVTQRVFFADKLVNDTTLTLGVVARPRFEALADTIGITLDPTRGHALARVVDCDLEAAALATVNTIDPDAGGVAFRVLGDHFELGAAASEDALVGLLNLTTPMEVPLSAFPGDVAVAVESSIGDIVTRPGELAFILLQPNSEVSSTPPAETDWSCVGTIDDPTVTEPNITLTINVQASSAFAPNSIGIAGARVTVCLDETANCAVNIDSPIDSTFEALTDASGSAQITVATGMEGFDGQLIITGTSTDCE